MAESSALFLVLAHFYRIIKWFELEGAFEAHVVQPPKLSQGLCNLETWPVDGLTLLILLGGNVTVILVDRKWDLLSLKQLS